eukprot:scaffold72150_cov47-Phaeocystis_antarctica.AAC.1
MGVRGGVRGYGVIGSHLRALEGGALARSHDPAQQLCADELRPPRHVPALRPALSTASASAATATVASATPAASATRGALGHLTSQLAQVRPAARAVGGELRQGCGGLGLGRRRVEPPAQRMRCLGLPPQRHLPPQGPPLARRLAHSLCAPLPRRRRGRRRGRWRVAGGWADGRRRAMRSLAERGLAPTPATVAITAASAAAAGTLSKGDGRRHPAPLRLAAAHGARVPCAACAAAAVHASGPRRASPELMCVHVERLRRRLVCVGTRPAVHGGGGGGGAGGGAGRRCLMGCL